MQVIQAFSCRGVKGSAMVMAEYKDTGLLLRVDVIVDKVHSFKIVNRNELYNIGKKLQKCLKSGLLKGLKFRSTIESGGNAKDSGKQGLAGEDQDRVCQGVSEAGGPPALICPCRCGAPDGGGQHCTASPSS